MAVHQHGMAEDRQIMQLTADRRGSDHALIPEMLDVSLGLLRRPILFIQKNDPTGTDSGGVQ